MTRTTKSKMLSFLLCFVMIATTFCQTAMTVRAEENKDITITDAQGTAVQDVTLPKNGPKDQKTRLTANAGVSADARYQWQILASADPELWVDIRGEKDADISVSYPMVCNLIDKDTASTSLRCKIKDGDKTLTSDAVKVTVTDAEKLQGKSRPTVKAIRAAAAKTASLATPQADEGSDAVAAANDGEEKETCSIIINYVFANGQQAANPWTATVAKGSSYSQTVTSPTVVGYAPDKATVDVNVTGIQEDQTYTVTYNPAEVEFTVKHYQQNIDNDKYTLADTETKKGYTESAVGGNLKKTYEGFTGLLYDTTTKIAADGSTVVEIYYDRNYYLMTFDLDGGYGVEPIYARYGAKIDVGTPTKAGYNFSGWTKDGSSATIPATMPAAKNTYKATWTAKDGVDFTVVFWYENADDNDYSYAGAVKQSAKAGTSVSSDTYKDTSFTGRDTAHFTYNSAKAETVTVKGDGSTVLNVYYTRNTYTLTFGYYYDWDFETVATITAKWNAKISDEFNKAPFNTTYNGRAWKCTDTSKYSYALQTLDRMPGFDATFKLYAKSSNTKKTIYYYVQKVGTTVSPDTWPTSAANFDSLKQVDTYFNFATYDEEYHEIQGFTRYSARTAGFSNNQKKFSNNKLDLYYLRNSYTLKFYNYDAFVTDKEKSVQYEAALKGSNFTPDYPANLEPNAYEFAGWYTSPGCYDGSEVDWESMTMPASDVTLYAKWAPKTHKVTTWLTDDMKTPVDVGDTGTNEQTIQHGKTATAPADPENGKYTFVGWFYKDADGNEKAFDFSMPVNRDLDLYAKWSSNVLVEYTINYALKDGTVIASQTTGSALAGTTKTFDAKAGTELNERYQTGYFPESSSHSITMDINGNNEDTFVYVPKEKVNYTVRYLEKGTEKVLHEAKTDTTSDAVVTEKFQQIKGYAPDAYQKRLVLSANDDENVITFWYTEDDKHAPVQVVHWTQNIVGEGYTEYQSSTDLNGEIGKTYTENSLDISGFSYNATKSNATGELTAAGLVLNLYYDRIEYPYEFRFLEQGTDKTLDESVTGSARYQAQVTQSAKSIPGYTLVSAENQAINIAIEDPAGTAKKNVKIFYYKENDVTINYKVAGDGGTVAPGSETVKAVTGTAAGSTPTADKGYKFVGWYTDKDCTNKVDAAWVDDSNKLTPQKEGSDTKMYKAATYYAKFEKDVADLTITKTGCSDTDVNQSFIFEVRDKDDSLVTTVTIHGNSSATIKDLQIGEYTVTEKTGWSWRYGPTQNDQKITLEVDEKNEVTFVNTREKGNWLNGSSWCRNVFNAESIDNSDNTTPDGN